MNGEIAQVCALASHGNAYLRGSADAVDEGLFATFHYATVRFRDHYSAFWIIMARDPASWFRKLRRRGVQRFGVSYGEMAVPREHRPSLSAFVGGAGKWLALSETPRDVTEWHPRWELARTGGPDGTRWQVTYDTFVVQNVSLPASFDVDAANARLEAALRNATALARDQSDLSHWAAWFDRATAALQSNAPESLIEKPSVPVLAASAHPLSARRAVAAAQCAWVFGGMMSWNDFASRDPSIDARHRAITAELYDAVLGATLSGVNTLL